MAVTDGVLTNTEGVLVLPKMVPVVIEGGCDGAQMVTYKGLKDLCVVPEVL